MAIVQTLIGNVKGPQGAQGEQGATGPQGDAATINVGSVSTTAYGNPAQVVNVGTENEAILNFVIPQGRPGQATTTMGGLTLDTITTSTADFPSPQVGDTGATAFGKIVKFFADALSALNSKLNAANVVNNLTTTEAGYALDARAGKALNDSLAAVEAVTDTVKTQAMFNKLSITVTTSSTGNANINNLANTYVIFAVRGPVGVACAFIGRGGNGAYYVHITDSSGNALSNTSVTLDVYYV